MAPSFSGLIYLFSFLVFGFLTYRFFQYFKQEKTYISQAFFYFGLSFNLCFLITAIGGIFFPNNLNLLKFVVIEAAFFQGLGCAFLGALLVYLKFPQISPKYGFMFIFFLGTLGAILAGVLPFNPHLMENNWIDWDIQPWSGVFRLATYLLTFLPLGLVMIQQGLSSSDPLTKKKSLGMGLIFLSVLLYVPLLFVARAFLPKVIGEDWSLLIPLILVLTLIIFTQKPPKPKWVREVE